LLWAAVALAVCSLAGVLPADGAESGAAGLDLAKIGTTKGICVLLGDTGCRQALSWPGRAS